MDQESAKEENGATTFVTYPHEIRGSLLESSGHQTQNLI